MHPGYDIESRDEAGRIVRFIEVKATAGLWSGDGVGVTSREFETARQHGERYWLYVVELVETDHPRLLRIRNPALRVNQFMYDDGWRGVAEVQSDSAE